MLPCSPILQLPVASGSIAFRTWYLAHGIASIHTPNRFKQPDKVLKRLHTATHTHTRTHTIQLNQIYAGRDGAGQMAAQCPMLDEGV